jgi:LysM repeat protein
MNPALWLLSSFALVLILPGCTNQNSTAANDPLGTGPFDSRGNYREEWADDPSKWRKPGSRPQSAPADEVPVIAKNEEPPPNSSPLPAGGSTTPKIVKTTVTAPVKTTETSTRPKPTAPKTTNVDEKPKPTVVKAKPKPKPKPKITRHVVKKGDTLSGIASRYGSSVSKIRSANGISGSLIRPGQSLIIPKR